MDSTVFFQILLLVTAGYIIFSRFAPVKGLRNLDSRPFQEELERNKNKTLIDVREPQEYQEGYIPGAINIPLSQLKSRINQIPKDKDVFLYCRSGMRSKQAARILVRNKYENLSHLQRGIISWQGKVKKSK